MGALHLTFGDTPKLFAAHASGGDTTSLRKSGFLGGFRRCFKFKVSATFASGGGAAPCWARATPALGVSTTSLRQSCIVGGRLIEIA